MGTVGTIQEAATGRTCTLEPDHSVGRAPPPASALHIDKAYVSAVHAAVRWVGEAWIVRDLGSRNGTYVDGVRLESGHEQRIHRGSEICFGRLEERWTLVDGAPPVEMAVPVMGGSPILIDHDMLALPSRDDPRATIYRADEGGWTLEHATDPPRALVNRETFELEGALWRFCCLDVLPGTLAHSGNLARPLVRDVRLEFAVSRNEEFVQLVIVAGGKRLDLGARVCNYLLLTLARQRLEDAREGLPETSCGWVDQEDLAHDPAMAPPRISLDVFRIRDQLAKVGIADPAHIVERRQRPSQLRVGTGHLSVTFI